MLQSVRPENSRAEQSWKAGQGKTHLSVPSSELSRVVKLSSVRNSSCGELELLRVEAFTG